jgi:hypothetical protein
MGWFPVAPLNMILASAYIANLFHLSQAGFSPLGTPIASRRRRPTLAYLLRRRSSDARLCGSDLGSGTWRETPFTGTARNRPFVSSLSSGFLDSEALFLAAHSAC